MSLALIAAVAENNVLGYQNQLPWRLPADLKYFKQHTLNKAVIMGRKTYESIGRPLPQRKNIVITRNTDWQAAGCTVCHSLTEAIAVAQVEQLDAIMMGGAELYRQALPQVQRMYLTRVHASPIGDAFFPEYALTEWREISAERFSADEQNQYDYSFLVLERT